MQWGSCRGVLCEKTLARSCPFAGHSQCQTAAKQTLLAKAETISGSDGASDKGYKTMSNSSCERGMRPCERKSPEDPETSAGGAEGAPGTRAELPAAHDENHGEAGCPPADVEDPVLEHLNVSIRKL